jgi:hypothetical protein
VRASAARVFQNALDAASDIGVGSGNRETSKHTVSSDVSRSAALLTLPISISWLIKSILPNMSIKLPVDVVERLCEDSASYSHVDRRGPFWCWLASEGRWTKPSLVCLPFFYDVSTSAD